MAREKVNFRISRGAIEALTDLAREHQVTISEVVRACFAVAFNHPHQVRDALRKIKEMP